jgi:hypothetical protein
MTREQKVRALIPYWLGHANMSITDIYSRVSEDREYRLEVAKTVGIDFGI